MKDLSVTLLWWSQPFDYFGKKSCYTVKATRLIEYKQDFAAFVYFAWTLKIKTYFNRVLLNRSTAVKVKTLSAKGKCYFYSYFVYFLTYGFNEKSYFAQTYGIYCFYSVWNESYADLCLKNLVNTDKKKQKLLTVHK